MKTKKFIALFILLSYYLNAVASDVYVSKNETNTNNQTENLLAATVEQVRGSIHPLELLSLHQQYEAKSHNMTNGYAKAIRCDKFDYNNMWNKKTPSMISRATNGEMILEWISDTTKIISDDYAQYLFIAGVDQATTPVNFDLAINGVDIGAIQNLHGPEWTQITSGGVKLHFIRYGLNEWKEGFGFLTVSIPKKLVQINKPTTFKLTGRKEHVNTWLMIFRTENLIEEIKFKSKNDKLYDIFVDGDIVKITTLPEPNAKYHYRWANGKQGKPTISNLSDKVLLSFPKQSQEGLQLFSNDQELFSIANIDSVVSSNSLEGTYLMSIETTSNPARFIVSREYSNAIEQLKKISSGLFRNADTHIMVSSHQDIGWVDSPYQCIEDRDKKIITPALELMLKYPDYCYSIENSLLLDEYIERHPDKTGLFSKLIGSGQLSIGASYTQPYEEIQSDEALVRQFYFGKRYIDKTFKGSNQRTYWNVDVPGRTPQMPQILKKCGVDYLMYSRHKTGIYRWVASDNCSDVIVFTIGHYTAAAQFLRNDPESEIDRFTNYLSEFDDYRKTDSNTSVVGMLSAEDMSKAHTYYNWIEGLNGLSSQYDLQLPKLKHSTPEFFMDALTESCDNFPVIKGERPNLWQYIHSAGHADAFISYRKATRLTPQAELFSTVNTLLREDPETYPTEELNNVWRAIIYPDHGWGGNNGNITDSLFNAKYVYAHDQSQKILGSAVNDIAAFVKTKKGDDTPIIVFNGASWSRSETCTTNVPLSVFNGGKFILKEADGDVVDWQIEDTDPLKNYVSINFIATDVPSMGYKTYYISESKKENKSISKHESAFYDIDFVDGELRGILDKENNRQLFDVSKFAIADVICMQSVGNGAGEFSTMQRPSMDHYEQASKINNRWSLVSEGDVYSLFSSTAQFRDATVVRYMKVFKSLKRIDFSTDILNFNGAEYLEYRQMFPVNKADDITYQVPFGAVTVGQDEMEGVPGERYLDSAKDIHPRTSSGWIAAWDKDMSVTLTSSAALVDYIDPTDLENQNTILQAILFASRKSCHPSGEFYYQKGDHHFELTIGSDTGAWQNDAKRAMSTDFHLITVCDPKKYADAYLPEELSFFNIDCDNAIVTAVKKAEDDNDVIIRLYDLFGETSSVSIESFFKIKEANQTDMLEYNPTPSNPNNITLGAKAIETFKLNLNNE